MLVYTSETGVPTERERETAKKALLRSNFYKMSQVADAIAYARYRTTPMGQIDAIEQEISNKANDNTITSQDYDLAIARIAVLVKQVTDPYDLAHAEDLLVELRLVRPALSCPFPSM